MDRLAERVFGRNGCVKKVAPFIMLTAIGFYCLASDLLRSQNSVPLPTPLPPSTPTLPIPADEIPFMPVFPTPVSSSTPLPPPTDALLDPTVATSGTIFTQGAVGTCNIISEGNATTIKTPSKQTTTQVAEDFCAEVTTSEEVKYTSAYDCSHWIISIYGDIVLQTVDGQTIIGNFDSVPAIEALLALTNSCTFVSE